MTNDTGVLDCDRRDADWRHACRYLFNLIGATQSFVVLILSAVVGRFLDAGYQQTLIIVGTVLVSVGSFILSVVNGDGGFREGNYALTWLTQG